MYKIGYIKERNFLAGLENFYMNMNKGVIFFFLLKLVNIKSFHETLSKVISGWIN